MRTASKKWCAVFVLPTFIAFCIAFLVPFVMGLYLSFCEFRTVSDAQFVGLQNYIRAFSENNEFINKHIMPQLNQEVSKLIAKGPKYGIFTIATSTIWTLASLVVESFSYLLENEKKEFFSIIGKPVNINTILDTWTVHNYIEGKQAMLKMYRLGK